MINATITTSKYVIKTCRLIKSMTTLRVIIPKKWDCDRVNVVLWEDDVCNLKISAPDEYEFNIPNCGEIFLKNVLRDDKRQYIYLPISYDGQQVLIVPV